MKHRGIFTLCCISLICLAIQVLPIISVPITSPKYNIYLSVYRNLTFGVFGICDDDSICSVPKFGYPSVNSSFYVQSNYNDWSSEFGGVELPSQATYKISKLLVVHVVGWFFTFVVFFAQCILFGLLYSQDMKAKREDKTRGEREVATEEDEEREQVQDADEIEDDRHLSRQVSSESLGLVQSLNKNMSDVNVPNYLNFVLAFTLLSFLSALLAFLADILLFVPQLSWLGWLQLLPIILFSISSSMICLIKRSAVSRKYIEELHKYENDDMRSRRLFNSRRWNDADSDDGFNAFTGGTYTFNGDRRKDSFESEERPYEEDGQFSIASSHNNSNDIQLTTFETNQRE